jgi:transcriptional regulator with XRE-family HTH domain
MPPSKRTSSEEPVEIGHRLRDVRLRRRMTLDQLAQATGLTKGFVSEIERDRASPSIASLVRICRALEITLGSLFDEPFTVYAPKAERTRIDWGEGVLEYRITTKAEPRLEFLDQTIEPGGGAGEEPYSPTGAEIEFVYVLRGRLEVLVGSEGFTLSAGDSLTFPARVPHTFRNPSTRSPSRAIWVLSPPVG